MDNEALKTRLTEILPAITFEEGTALLTANVEAAAWLLLAKALRNEAALGFDYLFCVTCVDWKTHIGMVYHLESTSHRHSIVIKVKLDHKKPEVETVNHIWKTAEFHEREAYEMFGVNFLNHPDLRLLILPDGWEGRHPMRKDYDDPVNMIKL
ncbi:MAG: NADH-quinone oxidoreductase subunit C [Bacteroidetes bacterium]|nr:NADH-quinone oxidoreductase subunit C [Bacteroidota bacterium]